MVVGEYDHAALELFSSSVSEDSVTPRFSDLKQNMVVKVKVADDLTAIFNDAFSQWSRELAPKVQNNRSPRMAFAGLSCVVFAVDTSDNTVELQLENKSTKAWFTPGKHFFILNLIFFRWNCLFVLIYIASFFRSLEMLLIAGGSKSKIALRGESGYWDNADDDLHEYCSVQLSGPVSSLELEVTCHHDHDIIIIIIIRLPGMTKAQATRRVLSLCVWNTRALV